MLVMTSSRALCILKAMREQTAELTVRRLGLLTIILLVLGTHAIPAQAQPDPPVAERPGFSPSDCPSKVPAGYTVECGTVTVPEDHSRPGSPSLQLPVAIVHSVGENPAPDPVLFIDGGPGSRTLDVMSFWLEFISPLLETRDVVFFDQRGTGYSQPALRCPEMDPYVTDPLEGYRLIEPLVVCRDRLTSQGIDLSAYTSAQNAADIGLLREALGYEEWNLYGVSYGTRVALTVLRDRPQGVRSAILDAMTPIEANLLLEDPAHAAAARQRLFAACDDDPICRTVYPDLERVYADVVHDLAIDPVPLEIYNTKTGESKTEVLDGAAFNGWVLDSLPMPNASGAPGLIYEVQAGNYQSIVAALESGWESEDPDQEQRAAIGLQLAVICGEEAPFVTPAEMEKILIAYPPEVDFSATLDEVYYTACQAWGAGPANPLENMPVSSDVPVLILTGEYDAARTPDDVRRAAETLSRSTVVEFPGAGHSVVLAGPCPLAIMNRFLDDPAAAPDVSCTADMDTPQFFVTVNPTRPITRIVAVLVGTTGLSLLLYAGIGLGGLAARRRIPWRVTLRQVGWRPLVLSGVLSVTLYMIMPAIDLTFFYERSLAQVIVIVGPLVMAIQTAFLVAPDDEPALELMLACPHPFHWLAIERVAIGLAGQSLVALGVMLIGAWELGAAHILLAMAGWIASVLLLSGLVAFVSAHTQRAMPGVLIGLLAWFVLGAAGSDRFEVLLPAVPLGFPPPWPRPLGLIQPLLWTMHPFLSPGSLTRADFFLNRVIVSGLGLGLMALAMVLLANTERLLLGEHTGEQRRSRTRRKAASAERAEGRKPPAHVKLAQLGAMVRYELLMSWRRGTLRTVLLSVLAFPQVMVLLDYLFAPVAGEQAAAKVALWPEAALLMGTGAAIFANVTTLVMIVLLLPLVLAELIPLDRQYRVREIIDALPITGSHYMAGKLMSVWPVVVGGLTISAALSGAFSWAQNGPYHVGTLIAFWVTGVIPLALFASLMAVMLPAGQSSRRRAILLGMAAAVVSLMACFFLPVGGHLYAAILPMGLSVEKLADPAVRAALPSFPDPLSPDTLLRLGTTLGIMVAVWTVTVPRQEKRA
jgi:pimeloyl-ACP methyl ester carboxylesterase